MIGGLLKSTSTLAILAAAGLLVGGITVAPKAARAADLGGDCCADLEERVANLEATTARKGNRKMSLTITGNLTQAILIWDDGVNNGINVIQPDTIGGGLTFKGEGKVNSDVSVGFNMNFDARFGDPGDAADFVNRTYGAAGVWAADEWFVFVKSKSLGQLTLGHHSDPYKSLNGGVDLGGDSGANDYNGGVSDMAAGIAIRNKDGTYANGLSWAGTAVNQLGGTRGQSIRYDTPSLGGVVLSASWSKGDKTDTAGAPPPPLSNDVYSFGGRYDGTFQGTTVGLGAGFEQTNNFDSDNGAAFTQTFNEQRWLINGSIYNAPSGLYLVGEYDRVHNNEATSSESAKNVLTLSDANNYFVKAGWRKNVTGMGETNVYGSYERTTDAAFVGVTGTGYVFGVTQGLDAAASTLYLQYNHLSASDSTGALCNASGCADEQSLVAGLNVNF